jgi:hypothetical protein
LSLRISAVSATVNELVRHRGASVRARARRRTVSAAALRWIAGEPLVYDQAANELHRPACPRAPADSVELKPGDALKLVRAPTICPDCRPDVTTGLGT